MTDAPIPPGPSIPIAATATNLMNSFSAWYDYGAGWISSAIRWFKSFAVWTRLLMAVAFGVWISPWVVTQFANNGIALTTFKAAQADTAGRIETVLSQIQTLSQKLDAVGRLSYEANTKLDGLPAQFASIPAPTTTAPAVSPPAVKKKAVPRDAEGFPIVQRPPPTPELGPLEKAGNFVKGLVQ